MILNIYAVKDKTANALIRFAFGSNDSSFVRDNLPTDIYNKDTHRGIPFNELAYVMCGHIDTETFKVSSVPEPWEIDIEKAYQFKIENPTESVEKK